MAKSKSGGAKLKFDTMSVTVLLVMAIFGGVVGYYIGQSTGNGQTLMLREAATMLKEKASAMKDAGDLMMKNGTVEMREKGEALMQGATEMMTKSDGMMGTSSGY